MPWNSNQQERRPSQLIMDYNGSEKRSYIRIAYGPVNRPKCKIGSDELDVADISESGIRLVNNKGIQLDKRISGTVNFLHGESVAIEGDKVWEKDGELGLLLDHLISSEDMEKEKKYFILKLSAY